MLVTSDVMVTVPVPPVLLNGYAPLSISLRGDLAEGHIAHRGDGETVDAIEAEVVLTQGAQDLNTAGAQVIIQIGAGFGVVIGGHCVQGDLAVRNGIQPAKSVAIEAAGGDQDGHPASAFKIGAVKVVADGGHLVKGDGAGGLGEDPVICYRPIGYHIADLDGREDGRCVGDQPQIVVIIVKRLELIDW